MRWSEPRTGSSTRCRRRDYEETSSTPGTAVIIAVGGLIGTEQQWQAFDDRWRAKLKFPMEGKPPLKEFGLSDCYNSRNEFERYSRPESNFLTREFRQIIKESGVIGFAAAIDKIAWDELVTAERRQNMGPAENFCLTTCVRNALSAAKSQFNDDEVALVYDLGRKPVLPSRIEDFDWSRGIECPQVSSFTWAKVGNVTPLQGADMIATESYWFAQAWIKDPTAEPRIHFQDYVKSALGNGTLMTREIIMRELAHRNSGGTVKDAFRF